MNDSSIHTAYDYAAQKWVTGSQAISLRIAQIRQELETLRSDKAEAYVRFVGSHFTVAQAIAACERELEHLGASARKPLTGFGADLFKLGASFHTQS